MELNEKIWNVLLHYLEPLTDQEGSVSVITEDQLPELQKDLMTVFEGKEVAVQPKALPKPKEKKVKVEEKPEPVAPQGEQKSWYQRARDFFKG